MKSKTAARRHQHHRHGAERPKPAVPPMSDRGVYLGAIIIGLFVVMLGGFVSSAAYWPHIAVAYLALMLYAIVMAGWSVYRARHVSGWRQSLAKVPLRPLGYGTASGKALESAHGQPAVRNAMIMFTLASLLTVALLAFLVVR